MPVIPKSAAKTTEFQGPKRPSLFFNEISEYPAQWLRNLFTDAHVECRSIAELIPEELVGFDRVHLFAGIGGWEYSLRLAGFPEDELVFTGSCPCQPFSVAGKQKGKEDERHLWPEMYRLIKECLPPTIFGEQVAGKLGLEWLDGVCADMEALGYAVGAAVLPVAGVGAPHRRDRIYWVAYSDESRGADSKGHRPCDVEQSLPIEVGRQETPNRSGDNSDSGNAEWLAHSAETSNKTRWDKKRPGEWSQEQPRGGRPFDTNSRMGDADSVERGSTDEGPSGETGDGRGDYEERGDRWGTAELTREDTHEPWRRSVWVDCADGKRRRIPSPEQGVLPLAPRISGDVEQIGGYGNAIVPQLAAVFVRSFLEARDSLRK